MITDIQRTAMLFIFAILISGLSAACSQAEPIVTPTIVDQGKSVEIEAPVQSEGTLSEVLETSSDTTTTALEVYCSEKPEGYQAFTNAEMGVAFCYPDDWVLDNFVETGAIGFLTLSPSGIRSADALPDGLIVIYPHDTASMVSEPTDDVEELSDLAAYLFEMFIEDIEFKGEPSIDIVSEQEVFTLTANGKANSEPVLATMKRYRVDQIMVIVASYQLHEEAHHQTVEMIMDSVVVGEPKPRQASSTADWSPDGRKIVFSSLRDGSQDLYIMDVDGSNVVQLTNTATNDSSPDWSPNGQKIAYSSGRESNFDIYVVNADGSNIVQLTNQQAYEGFPDWSPNGKHIAFASNNDGDMEIYVIENDGSGLVQLTEADGDDLTPAWSPDGKQIAFVSYRSGSADIYLMASDGSNVVRITDDSNQEGYPTWSPDGRYLAFIKHRDNNVDVFTMEVDGTNLVRLTNHPAQDFAPAWSPDGTRIAFDSPRDGDLQIYVMDADGNNIVQLTGLSD